MNTRQNVPFAAFAALATLGLVALWRVDPPLPAGSPPVAAAVAAAAVPAAADRTTPAAADGVTRREALAASSLELVVVDAHDRRPIAAAAVEWREVAGTTRGRAVTSPTGAATLAAAAAGPWELNVRSAEHAALHAILPAMTGTAVVGLERGGELVITARDSADRPAAGVALALLPPRRHGEFGGDFVAFANAAPTPSSNADHAASDGTASASDGDGGTAGDGQAELVGAGDARGEGDVDAARAAAALPELVLRDGVFRLPDESAPADRVWHVDARYHALARRVVTGADGTARWTGLPPAAGYRFGILPPRHGDPEPAHERQRLTVGAAGVVVGAAPPRGLSGAFAIERAAPTHVGARITRDGTLRGRFVMPAGTNAPARLFQITQAGGGDTVAVTALDVFALEPTAADGSFVFTAVRPGDYALRTCWLEHGVHVRFASVTVRVPPGADIDLGDLPPTVGHSVTVEVGVEDTDGAPLRPEQVFEDPACAPVAVLLDVVPQSEQLADSLNELLTLPLGVPFTLHGLPAGRVQLTAMPSSVPPARLRGDVARLLAGETGKHTLPQADPLRPRLRVERGHEIAIAAVGPDGGARTLALVWTRDRATGHVASHALTADTFATGERLKLRPGDYELFAAVLHGPDAECASTQLTVPRADGAPLTVQLQPAARVRGTLRDASGRPAAGASLRWTLPGWCGASGLWPFAATSDDDGRFELSGLPAGGAPSADAGTPALPTLAAGWNDVALRCAAAR